MGHSNIYADLLAAQKRGEKRLAILFDPDKSSSAHRIQSLKIAVECGVDYGFVGGSLVNPAILEPILLEMRAQSDIPLVLFPGSAMQLSEHADALLFLSLISGRNPELLIGQQVLAAPYLRQTNLAVISTGYMLIDGGVRTSVQYMSNTQPIPADKLDIACSTALAGEMLGLKAIYLEAGSGALNPVSVAMIAAVRGSIQIPLIVGGGIRTPEQATAAYQAGADILVIGNAVESNPELIRAIAPARY